jgi:hypothetical protein
MNIKKERLMGVLLISTFLLTLTVPAVHAFEYPPTPLLLVTLDRGVSDTIVADVTLMGEGGVDLDPFWDIAGFDMTMNFQGLEGLSVTIDPDGWFKSFWPFGLSKRGVINNADGTVWVYMAGIPAPGGIHIPPSGQGRLFSVTFAIPSPPMPVEISLRNPRRFLHRATIDADAGLIDLTSPISTQWLAISTDDYGTHLSLDDWVDTDIDSELSLGDELILTDTSTGYWHRYTVHDIKGTLDLTHLFTAAVDDYIWMADFPNSGLENNGLPGRTATGGTGAEFNGFGNPYWTGNFSLVFPVQSVNEIVAHYLPFTGDEYTQVLTEGVHYKVHDDENLVELLVPLDVDIINEHWIDNVNNNLNGWPWINYVASGIESVYRKFPAYNEYYGETEGFATNLGYVMTPPSEWWYDPEWPWELEGWWALGYGGLAGPWTWPEDTEWWINYTAASYITVDFNADPDPKPYYVEWCEGTYEEFLALGDPMGTTWREVYPDSVREYTVVDWTDSDSSGDITTSDILVFEDAVGNLKTFHVDKSATDMIVDQHLSIDDVDLESPFYGMDIIVDVAGFPHPEREMSPWHNSPSSKPIPHIVAGELFADFTVSPRYAKKDQDIRFDASTSCDPCGAIVSYEWDFGDGATATGLTVKHAYGLRGFYEATLTVTDNDAFTDSTSRIIAVQPLSEAKAEHAVYFVSKDEDDYNDLTAKVTNDGTESVEVTARFTTVDRRTGMLKGLPLEVTGMATAGTDLELTVGWNPTDHEWEGVRSKYTVMVELTYEDVDGTISAGKNKINFQVKP